MRTTAERRWYRRSPSLICYWRDDRPVLHDYRRGIVVQATAATLDVLGVFGGWRRGTALLDRFPGAGLGRLRSTLRALERCGLLDAAARRPADRVDPAGAWQAWHPAAAFLHFSTKDTPFCTDDALEARWLSERLRGKRLPSITASGLRRSGRVRLSPAEGDDVFVGTLLGRRTWRDFGSRPVSRPVLGTLLGLTFGVQAWLDFGARGRMPLKTSPSGGACHPLEAYVLVRRVEGIRPGVYRYDSVGHALERRSGGASAYQVTRLLGGQHWFARAAIVVFVTAVIPRKTWRYPFARAYRSLLIETGHFSQTFLLTASWLGLAPFCTNALADSEVERVLGVDGTNETVLFAVGAGSRPETPQTDVAASR